MKKIKINYVSRLEEELQELGATYKQARIVGSLARSILGDIQNKRDGEEIRFCVDGNAYVMNLEKV